LPSPKKSKFDTNSLKRSNSQKWKNARQRPNLQSEFDKLNKIDFRISWNITSYAKTGRLNTIFSKFKKVTKSYGLKKLFHEDIKKGKMATFLETRVDSAGELHLESTLYFRITFFIFTSFSVPRYLLTSTTSWILINLKNLNILCNVIETLIKISCCALISILISKQTIYVLDGCIR